MIKLSLQSLCYRDTFSDGLIDLKGIIHHAGEFRLDGIDIDHRHFDSLEPDYLENIRLMCLKAGLHICYIGVSNDFMKDGVKGEREVQSVKKWIDIAAQMGIGMVRVFGGRIPEGESFETMYPILLRNTKKAVSYGRKKGVVCGLHNHNHGSGPSTGQEVLRLLDDVRDRYYSHILDTGQYKGSPGASLGDRGIEETEWGFYDSIKLSAPKAVQIRAKLYRIASGNELWLDYHRIMPILVNAKFNGWMSIVFEGQDEMNETDAVPLGVNYLRALLTKYNC